MVRLSNTTHRHILQEGESWGVVQADFKWTAFLLKTYSLNGQESVFRIVDFLENSNAS